MNKFNINLNSESQIMEQTDEISNMEKAISKQRIANCKSSVKITTSGISELR